jgi:two-component system chemotaxis response regulator CheB
MPRSALEYVEADHSVPSTEIGALLARLVREQLAQEDRMGKSVENVLKERIGKEVQLASGTNISPKSVLELGEPSAFACPECHGILVKITEGKFSRFRCHTGHGFTEDALLEAVMQSTGKEIWQVTRGLQETEMLLEHMGQHIRHAGDPDRAKKFFTKAREIGKRASQFQRLALEHESLSRYNLEQGHSTD